MKTHCITVEDCVLVHKVVLASACGPLGKKSLEVYIVLPDGAITYYVNGEAKVSIRQAVQHYNELPGP